jgi:hypothetical protein
LNEFPWNVTHTITAFITCTATFSIQELCSQQLLIRFVWLSL